MGLLGKIFGRKSDSFPLVSIEEAFLRTGAGSSAGIAVTPDSAMRAAAVFSCIRVRSESAAVLPLILYQRLANGGKERLVKDPLYRLLHDSPNRQMTAYTFFQMAVAQLDLRGSAYALISRTGGRDGRVKELLPIHPDRVAVRQDSRTLDITYQVSRADGATVEFPAADILHFKALSLDGIRGLTPIGYARETIGLSLATQQHGGKLFANASRPSGVLTVPAEAKLSDEARKHMKESWQAATSGENVGKAALLEGGTTWAPMTMTNTDAQYIETQKFTRSEIAGIFRVPPHMIGDLDHATFTNIEHQGGEFVTNMLATLKCMEQEIVLKLLGDRPDTAVEHLVDALLRSDTQTRFEAYASAVSTGWMSRNEVRLKENLNPQEGLDAFLTPLNMTDPTNPDPSNPDGNQPA